MNKIILFLVVTLSFQTAFSQFLANKKNLKKYQGYFDFYYDENEDRIYLEVDKLDAEFLYVNSLSSGVGSNDIGLDRGQLGNEQVVFFRKAGNKLLLIQPNLKFRALTNNELEKRSVAQAFAKSVLFGFPIKEQRKGSYIIDLTQFLMQDAHGVANRLKSRGQGSYSLSEDRSALAMERTKAFPRNIEFEAMLTFKGEAKGDEIKSVAPNASFVTVIQHHSFIELPDANYETRKYDPRCGSWQTTYMDYATPVHQPIVKRFITRHRLKKKDPNAAVSEAIEPIVYYLDNGTPEPVRSALLDGGRWWNQAFEAIGYKNAFQVKMLPEDADPMDVRYNVIQWVHRSTRGWSYGGSVTDPRTGEIIKGHVSLGSLRIRQDFLIAQALMNKPFAERDDNYQPMLELALARIRQLSAHEIGHTLGFAHNFAASTDGRASVMDYPHPKVDVKEGELDFSNAYDNKIGAWDKMTVAYAYSDFAEGTDETDALLQIMERAQKNGLRFITDADARPQGGAHAKAHLWDNGKNAAIELERVLEIRKLAINNFSKDNIRSNEPYSVLEDVFVPLYFFHRYQTEAAVKLVGGLEYNYAIKNDGQVVVEMLNKQQQTKALDAILKTISPEALAIPEDKLKLFPPRAYGYSRTRESFKGKTGVAFDALGAAETASEMSLALLLHPQRANRLVQQKALDERQFGLQELVQEILEQTVRKKAIKGYHGEIQKVINWKVLHHLMQLASDNNSYPQVTEVILFEMMKLKTFLGEKRIDPTAILMKKAVEGFVGNPTGYKKKDEAPKIPDGSPIGSDACNFATYQQ
ncbi:zinc-dependent metalloprotease [Sungkyunkwania multivorans]|uniref:Zinc-dependent metalloprotease n=1 Tax=Sungkyunkwania multivorans TaxID=1173618 RepID=A0ABW3CY32_9FLAO